MNKHCTNNCRLCRTSKHKLTVLRHRQEGPIVCQLHHNHLTKEKMQSLCRDDYEELSGSVVMCMLPAILVYTSLELELS